MTHSMSCMLVLTSQPVYTVPSKSLRMPACMPARVKQAGRWALPPCWCYSRAHACKLAGRPVGTTAIMQVQVLQPGETWIALSCRCYSQVRPGLPYHAGATARCDLDCPIMQVLQSGATWIALSCKCYSQVRPGFCPMWTMPHLPPRASALSCPQPAQGCWLAAGEWPKYGPLQASGLNIYTVGPTYLPPAG